MEEGALIFRCIYIYILIRESVKTETTRDPEEDVEERRRVLLLKAFLGSLRARSKDCAIDMSSPQSTGDRLDLRNTNNNQQQQKGEKKIDVIERAVLLLIFGVRAVVVVFLKVSRRRRRRRQKSSNLSHNPFPFKSLCLFPKNSPSTKSARKSHHV